VRLVHIMLSCDPRVEARLAEMLPGLLALGHETAVITHPSASAATWLRTLPISQLALKAALGARDRRAAARLGPLLRTLRADAVLLYDPVAMALARQAMTHSLPFIAVTEGDAVAWAQDADCTFLSSHAAFQMLIEAGGDAQRCLFVPPMIDYRSGFIRPLWRQPPTILVHAPLHEAGGVQDFLMALSQLAAQGVPCRAQIVGEGVRVWRYRWLARRLGLLGSVQFLPPLSDISAYYAKADLFCYPVREGQNGRALLPAMAAKLPIVATDAEGPSIMLSHGQEGWLVGRDNPDALAAGLAHLLQDEDMARTLASNAFHRLKQHHVREKVCRGVSEYLEEMVRRHAVSQAQVPEVMHGISAVA